MSDLHDELRKNRQERRREDQRLNESIRLMHAIRGLCFFMTVVLLMGGLMLGFIFNYQQGTRREIHESQDQAGRVEAAFQRYTEENVGLDEAHERTQRLLCGWYRANGVAPPNDEDCVDR